MKALLRIFALAALAKIAYEFIQKQQASHPLPESGPFEPAPMPERPMPGPSGSDDLTAINGIGPVYAARLADSDIESFEQLAAASTEELADTMDTSAAVVENWQEQARGFLA